MNDALKGDYIPSNMKSQDQPVRMYSKLILVKRIPKTPESPRTVSPCQNTLSRNQQSRKSPESDLFIIFLVNQKTLFKNSQVSFRLLIALCDPPGFNPLLVR